MVRKRYDVAPKFNVKDEGVLIQQQAGSTANLLEIKDSSNNTLMSISNMGNLTVSGNTNLSANTSIGNVSSTELSYVDGVTSAIQTQLNARSLASTTGLVKLAQVNLASNYGFTSAFSATYRNYYIIMEYVQFAGNTEMYFRLMSGASVDSSLNYYKTRLYVQGNGTPGGSYLSADSYGRIGYGGTLPSTYWIHLSSPFISGVHKMFTSYGVYSDNSTRGFIEQNHCQMPLTGQYDGITLAGNSYGFSAGVATLYGELA